MWTDRRGFTVLEAVVAMLVVGLAAVAALSALAADLRAAHRARRAVEGVALAEERLERVRLLPREALQRLPDSLRTGRPEPPLELYRWTVRSTPLRDEPELFQVVVTVSWEDGGSHLVSTLLYRPPARESAVGWE